MNAQESISAMRILQHAGYDCKFEGDNVVVKDPVQCSQGGGRRWIEYKDVTIKSVVGAIRFVNARD